MTPDPAGMAAADPANPQSWNRYAYVMNNPLNATDPLGLQTASQNDQCSPNSGQPVGDGNQRQPGKECGTNAIDGSDPHPTVTTPPVYVTAPPPDAVEILEYDANLPQRIQQASQNRPPIKTTLTISAAPPKPQPLKPGCNTRAVGPALSAMRNDLFSPPGADPKSDMQDLAKDKDAQRAAAGTLYVTANAVKPLAPALDAVADWIPIAGEVLVTFQVLQAGHEGWKAYKASVDQCYGGN